MEKESLSGGQVEPASTDNLYDRLMNIAGAEDYSPPTARQELRGENKVDSPAERPTEAVNSPVSSDERVEGEADTEEQKQAAEQNPNESQELADQRQSHEETKVSATPTYKVKVDGEELEVSLDELLLGYQRQQDYTRKTQKIAELSKQMEQERIQQQLELSKSLPLEHVIQGNPVIAFERIKQELADIDKAIQEAVEQDNIFDLPKLQYKETKLRQMAGLVHSRLMEAQRLSSEVRNSIPDFDKKVPVLVNWVVGLLPDNPFTPEELDFITNPINTGAMAAKFARMINLLYDKVQGNQVTSEQIEQKVVKAPPKPLNSPGTSVSGESSVGRNLDALKARAQESGDAADWAAYINAMTKSKRKK